MAPSGLTPIGTSRWLAMSNCAIDQPQWATVLRLLSSSRQAAVERSLHPHEKQLMS